ncbi:phospholipase D/transphosphatidylase [Thioalkalivibrio nitratireducens DSM 14787]|uniref:TVP38/TMEM64 family membrane protein n=1 Tax=Thioalkalivibrio nitratireducens (strain DSM 14787 / UNIQEM 213 / ALEN2) TaxID=1255043 RepID=L0DUZ9_THIND|nr:VTT domain-containing protein [Thioalkalivibrio nitratireducens]AGA32843.1 phospholipase D/transphosphatidylase [Thioalkalivibrio nitratireducens DSM 14787]
MSPRFRLLLFLGVFVILAVMALVWGIALQDEDWGPTRVRALAERFEDRAWLPWAVFAGTVIGLQVAIPQLVLVPVAVIVLGPWSGFAIAYLGTVAGAVVGYLAGRYLGRRPVRRLSGPSMKRLSRSLARRGIQSMVVINMLPVVSQTLINLLAGTTHIRFRDFLVGSVIGILPPTAMVTLATHLLLQVGRMPTPGEALALLLAVFLTAMLLWYLTRRAWNWLYGA